MLTILERATLAIATTLPKPPDVGKGLRARGPDLLGVPRQRLRGPLRILWRAHPRYAAHARQLAAQLERHGRELRLPPAELSLLVVGDAAMRRLNRERRGIDRSTDVLSFPAAPTPGSCLLGDLVISLPWARRAAARLQRPLARELALYAVHGLLHLRGHDHHDPASLRRMARTERKLLGESGLIDRVHPSDPISRVHPSDPISRVHPSDPSSRIAPSGPIARSSKSGAGRAPTRGV